MKLVADTSVWVDFLNGVESDKCKLFDFHLENDLVIVGDLILLEILRGIRSDKNYNKTKSELDSFVQVSMLSPELASEYAGFYRILRKKGITVRKSGDIIVAGYCIIHDLPLLQKDRDFKPYEKRFGLRLL